MRNSLQIGQQVTVYDREYASDGVRGHGAVNIVTTVATICELSKHFAVMKLTRRHKNNIHIHGFNQRGWRKSMTRKEKVMEMEPACVNEEFEAGVWGAVLVFVSESAGNSN